MKVKMITDFLDKIYPSNLASDFDEDKIGLVIGDENLEVNNVLLTLDLTIAVVEEAIKNNVNLIISHHPFVFNKISKFLFNSREGEVLNLMFQEKISLYVMHTNLDVGPNGVNDSLAAHLNLEDIEGVVEKDAFLRYGKTNLTLQGLSDLVKEKFNVPGIKTVGQLDKMIKKVAIIGGSGGQIEYIDEAINNDCDCLITGEIKLHIAQYAYYRNFSLIEVNHGVEKLVFKNVKTLLENNLHIKNVLISNINTDPLQIN